MRYGAGDGASVEGTDDHSRWDALDALNQGGPSQAPAISPDIAPHTRRHVRAHAPAEQTGQVSRAMIHLDHGHFSKPAGQRALLAFGTGAMTEAPLDQTAGDARSMMFGVRPAHIGVEPPRRRATA